MSLEKTFYLLKNAELRASELYALIGLSVAVARPKLSDLFKDLAEDEKLHVRQVEMTQSIFMQSKDNFLENPEAEKMIAEFMQNLEMTKSYFNQHHAQIQPHDLINLALDLEQNLVEKHRMFFAKVSDPQLKRLFESLNLADETHIRKLKNFQPG